MKPRPIVPSAVLLCLLAAMPAQAATVIRGARVFTGDQTLAEATVVIENGRIASVTPEKAAATADAEPGNLRFTSDHGDVVVSGNMTLLPGLIDGHVHAWGAAPERALNFGVTTVLDMFTDPSIAAAWREEQAAADVTDRADVYSAGALVTVEGGHGTQFGVPVPTLDDPEQAEAFVADRVAEGSDYIKVVYEAGRPGQPLPTHAPQTLPRIVAAAHAHDRLALFHVSTPREAAEAIAAGADGLVHVFLGEAAAPVVATAAEAGVFVTPALTVIEGFMGTGGGAELAADPHVAPFLADDQRGGLAREFPAAPDGRFEATLDIVAALDVAGVPIIAGTDAPNPGTAHGASLHRELELLTDAGLSAEDALRAATSVPADAFGLGDRGRIVAGARADLLLVRGDPTRDIRATRAIAAIWRNGVRVERFSAEAAAAGRARVGPGLLADFEDGVPLAAAGWVASTDAMAGGDSTVSLTLVAGAGGSVLRIEGAVGTGFAYPWAGAMVGLGQTMMQPVNAEAAGRLVFDARGEQGTFAVMAFAESLGQIPATVPFEADGQWRRVELPFGRFAGFEADGAQAFLFTGSGKGAFALEIDNVALAP